MFRQKLWLLSGVWQIADSEYYIINKNMAERNLSSPVRLCPSLILIFIQFICTIHSTNTCICHQTNHRRHQNENRGQAAQKAVKAPSHLKIALVDWAGHLERAICRERKYSPWRSRLSQL